MVPDMWLLFLLPFGCDLYTTNPGGYHRASDEAAVIFTPSSSQVYFSECGRIAGISTSAALILDVDVTQAFINLHQHCQAILSVNLSKGAPDDPRTIALGMLLKAKGQRCLLQSKRLTQTLSQWISERELVNHESLLVQDPLYQTHDGEPVRSMASPRHTARVHDPNSQTDLLLKEPAMYTTRSPRSTSPPITATPAFQDPVNQNVFIGHSEDEDYTNIFNEYFDVKGHPNSSAEHVREKRQAIALFGLGALFSWAVNGVVGSLSSLFHPKVSEAKISRNFHESASIDHQMQREVEMLNMTMAQALRALQEDEDFETQLVAFLTLSDMVEETFHRMDRFNPAIIALLHGNLHPDLVDPEDLKDKFEDIVEELKQHKAQPLFSNVLGLYSLSITHSFHKESLSFRIQLLIPGELFNTQRTLYRLIPFPIELPYQQLTSSSPGLSSLLHGFEPSQDPTLSSGYVMINAPEEFVAVGRTEDGELTVTGYSAADLQVCRDVKYYKICPAVHNIIKMGTPTKCIESLYRVHWDEPHHMEMIFKFCRLRTMLPEESHVIQLSRTKFNAYFPSRTTVTIICRPVPIGVHHGNSSAEIEEVKQLQGLQSFHLRAGCVAHTDQFEFASAAQISLDFINIFTADFTFKHHLPAEHAGKAHAILTRLPSSHLGMTVHDAIDQFDKDAADVQEASLWTSLLYGVAGVCGLLLCLWLSFCCCDCNRCRMVQCPGKRSSTPPATTPEDGNPEQEENIALNPMA